MTKNEHGWDDEKEVISAYVFDNGLPQQQRFLPSSLQES